MPKILFRINQRNKLNMRNLKDPDTWLKHLKICCIKFPGGKTKQNYRKKKKKIKNTTELEKKKKRERERPTLELQPTWAMRLNI